MVLPTGFVPMESPASLLRNIAMDWANALTFQTKRIVPVFFGVSIGSITPDSLDEIFD